MFCMEPPKLSRAVAGIVQKALDDANISLREVCRQTGISPTTLHARLKGYRPFQLDEIELIAQLVDIDVAELMRLAVTSAAA